MNFDTSNTHEMTEGLQQLMWRGKCALPSLPLIPVVSNPVPMIRHYPSYVGQSSLGHRLAWDTLIIWRWQICLRGTVNANGGTTIFLN